jgi:carotenoid cleavage dioxygenase-like enzyme
MLAPNDNTFVNTIRHGDRLLSVTDAPFILELDPKTMKVVGPFKFEDDLQGKVCYTGSAHPLPHPVTGEWVDFVGNAGILSEETTVRLYGLNAQDPHRRKSIADIVMDHPPYMHSFGITSKHIVLPRMPIKFDAKSVATKTMHSAFVELDLDSPGKENAFHVVPMDGSATRVYPLSVTDRLYYTHTVNTFENETGIVIDLCTLPANPFASNITVAAGKDKATRDKNGVNVVRRFLLPHAEDEPVRVEAISDLQHATDFTKINPRRNGVKHCFFWGVQWYTDRKAYGSMAIVKYDTCGGSPKRQFYRPSWFPSEPTFIPSAEQNAAEDDGVVVFTALDGVRGETHLLVLDAATMELVSEAGPFPRIGFTTHGEFYPSSPAAAATSILI